MQKFVYKIDFNAKDHAQSIQMMDALTGILKNMTPEDLILIGNKIIKDPGVVQKAKKYL